MSHPRFKEISPAAWEHPADAAALKALRSISGLDILISKTMGRLNEATMKRRMTKGNAPATMQTHPRLIKLYFDVLDTFDVSERWPLYIVPMGGVNAGAVGMESPFVILSSEAAHLSDDDIRVIIAHEIGHVLSGHVLYRTMMRLLLNFSWMAFSNVVTLPVVLGALMTIIEWERKSELSADRASALAMGGSSEVRRVMEKLNTGHDTAMKDSVDKLKAHLSEDTRRKMKTALDALEKMVSKHPPIEERITEVEAWAASPEFAAALAGDYPRRGAENPWAGVDFSRIRQGADKLSTVGARLSDTAGGAVIWLRTRAGLDT